MVVAPAQPLARMTSAVRPTDLDPGIAAKLKRDRDGLVVAVAQQHDTGEVLMVGWMDDEALHRTLTTGRCTYWSRSRQEYWVKGETSGHAQHNKAGIEQAAVVNAHKSPVAPDRVRTYNAVDQLMAVRAKDCAHHRPFGRELCSVAALNGLGEFTLDEGQIFVDRRIGKGETNA